jgi:hypothetical protein
MEITKYAALCLQALSATILGLNFAGVKVDALPRILQPLFLIPWYAYVVLFFALLAVVITQKEKIKHLGSAPPAPPVLQKIDTVPYLGVFWDIVAPAQHPREKAEDYARRLPTTAEARVPPKCPKCGVELEEKKGLIYGHIWRCVSCSFKKRNRDSFLTEGGRAEKIWRGKAEAAANASAAATTAATTVGESAAAAQKE